ncbi:MAG: hypothetical protein KJ811_01035, partial [Candidatus Margulisbacteria bacterium]|nr:hypothetical protein [Candidatus Margulisiibacteriota bacterium]
VECVGITRDHSPRPILVCTKKKKEIQEKKRQVEIVYYKVLGQLDLIEELKNEGEQKNDS